MLVHLNGQLVLAGDARISVFDRGFVFGDGVYEGLRAFADDRAPGGVRLIGLGAHIRRMQAGLDEARIAFDAAVLGPATYAMLEANRLKEAFVYWQVTRGTPGPGEPPRSRVPPPPRASGSGMRPTVFAYAAPLPTLMSIPEPPRKKVVTLPDIRWQLGHLKSISMMGNVITAIHAAERGGEEAIMLRLPQGETDPARALVSEGLATNIIAVFPRGDGFEIATPRLKVPPILAGVTRQILLHACPEIVERDIRAEELSSASELMLIGTTTLVTTISHVDNEAVGPGRPGPIAHRLFSLLMNAISDGSDDR